MTGSRTLQVAILTCIAALAPALSQQARATTLAAALLPLLATTWPGAFSATAHHLHVAAQRVQQPRTLVRAAAIVTAAVAAGAALSAAALALASAGARCRLPLPIHICPHHWAVH